jgi:hypothetical protein
MENNMKETGSKEKEMDLEYKFIVMEMNMKVIGSKIRNPDTEF